MTGNPTTTTYRVTINTNIGATFNYLLGTANVYSWLDTLALNDLMPLGLGNTISQIPGLQGLTSASWELFLTAYLSPGILAKGANAVKFSNAHWINNNGKCALQSTLTVTSDPVSVTDLISLIMGVGLMLSPIILACLGIAITGWTQALAIALAVAGGIIILSVAVDVLGSSAGNILVTGMLIVGVIAALILIPMAISSVKGKRQSSSRRKRS